MKLADSKVHRGGATADCLGFETSDIDFHVEGFRGTQFCFGIASKGGGTTIIRVDVGDKDIPLILREILEKRPKFARVFTDLATRAIELEKANIEKLRAQLLLKS
jgi:hypothetical protein